MPTEVLTRSAPELGEIQSTRNVLFISGMLGHKAGIEPIRKSLQDAYGSESSVRAFNSVISSDRPNPRRFEQMADVIRTQARSGLDIIVHSLGSTELWRAMKILRKKDPDFFNDPEVKRNLRFVLIGPSGFAPGIVDKIKYARNVIRMSTSSDGKIADNVTAFPPKGVSSDELSSVLRKISNLESGYAVSTKEGTRTNEEYLSEGEQAALDQAEILLREQIAKGNESGARKILKKREKATRRATTKVFNASTSERSKRGKVKGFGKGTSVLFRAIGKKPMRMYQELAGKGYNIDFFVPEFDFTVPLSFIERFFANREAAQTRTEIIRGSSHAGYALQPGEWTHVIKGAY